MSESKDFESYERGYKFIQELLEYWIILRRQVELLEGFETWLMPT